MGVNAHAHAMLMQTRIFWYKLIKDVQISNGKVYLLLLETAVDRWN